LLLLCMAKPDHNFTKLPFLYIVILVEDNSGSMDDLVYPTLKAPRSQFHLLGTENRPCHGSYFSFALRRLFPFLTLNSRA